MGKYIHFLMSMCLILLGVGNEAKAFTVPSTLNDTALSCIRSYDGLDLYDYGGGGYALLKLRVGGVWRYLPQYWDAGSITTAQSSITFSGMTASDIQTLEQLCGWDANSFKLLYEKGATESSFSNETEMYVIWQYSISGTTQTYEMSLYEGLSGSVRYVGQGYTSNSVLALYPTTPTAPSNLSVTTGTGQVSVAFTAPLSTGGLPSNQQTQITNYEYSTDGGTNWTAFSPSVTSSPVTIGGLANGVNYSIKLRAVTSLGVGDASSAVSVSLGAPQSAQSDFDQNADIIREQIQSVALQNIRNGVQEASGFMSSARDRFILCGDVSSAAASATCPSHIPFDINGSASVSTSSANIDGSFFGQFGNFDGTYRRMTSGDFNLQRDEDGNTTGALSGRIAWEYLTSDTTMLGWFVGAEYIQSDMTGTFTGDQTSFGASIGGYFVTELQDQLYLDGHLTVKQNEHDLQLTNGTLDLDSLYQSTSVLSGLTLTGVTTIDESSELWPTFSINAARTDLGTIGFTGTAYGLTDSTLSMDGGLVSYADVSVSPKYRAAMDGQTLANSLLVATVTPKAMCEYTELGSTTSRNCGTGLLLGLLGTTKDGNGTLELELGLDSIGGATRHSVALNADLRY